MIRSPQWSAFLNSGYHYTLEEVSAGHNWVAIVIRIGCEVGIGSLFWFYVAIGSRVGSLWDLNCAWIVVVLFHSVFGWHIGFLLINSCLIVCVIGA